MRTEALSWIDAEVEYSTDGTTWVSCSEDTLSVAVEGGERATADTHTGDDTTPVVTFGPKGSLGVTVRGLYTCNAATDAVTVAQTAYDADTDLYFRWFPDGKVIGKPQYTTGASKVLGPVVPVGEFSSADAIAADIKVRTAKITQSTYATS